ncbi:MAG TPA: enoyl-CoA hydratase/isomerase family protein [Burkholderiales bacterium]|nr:enoyl-CoA hydratase/isomerase family protein [Burkholderiales bacterium]
MTDELKVERHGHVAVLTLNRPESLNALTKSMTEAMREECDRMNDDPDVRAVVITGAGRGFCSGFDIKKGDLADPRRLAAYSVLDFAQHRLARLRTFAKPTIAAVNGVAVGGGLGLALACDIRICSTAAKFSTQFANIGMPVQDAVGAFLPQIIGLPKAIELIYTARMVDAAEALDLDLVTHVAEPEDLMELALAIAGQIANGPPLALAMSKQVVYRSIGKTVDEQLAYQNLGSYVNAAFAAHDVTEAVTAFREKRKPKFRGP